MVFRPAVSKLQQTFASRPSKGEKGESCSAPPAPFFSTVASRRSLRELGGPQNGLGETHRDSVGAGWVLEEVGRAGERAGRALDGVGAENKFPDVVP